jgi:hypothetical protein
MRNTKEIQEIIRDYFVNLCSNKLKNLEEMDKFLDTHDHRKLNQEDINYLVWSIAHVKLKQQERVSPEKKSLRPHGFFP